MMKEVTIVGGGLAGLSLAVGLRTRGVPVIVLESGGYPRHRVCGEFVSGVAGGTLEFLGLRDLFDDAMRLRSLDWYANGRVIHRDRLPEPAMGISRFVLDERLVKRVEALGGQVRTGVRARLIPAEGMVWAAGRRPRQGPWIGLKAHVRRVPLSADLEMHTGRNGYVGLAGVEDDWVNVCGLFRLDKTVPAKGSDLLAAYLVAGGNPRIAEILRQAEWREDSFSAVAGFQLGRQPVVPGLLCLGDAESMIPPFTGNGMAMAFQAAEMACGPLVAWASGTLAWPAAVTAVRRALRRRFRRRLGAAGVLHRILLAASGRSLLQFLSFTHMLPFTPMLALVR